MSTPAFSKRRQDARTIQLGPNTLRLMVTAEESGGGVSMVAYDVAPSFVAPPAPHAHSHEDWVGYVIEGTMALEVDGQEAVVPAGGSVSMRRGMYFRWWNPDPVPARLLFCYTPGGFEGYFVEAAAAVATLPAGPFDMTKLMPLLAPLWAKYGIKRR